MDQLTAEQSDFLKDFYPEFDYAEYTQYDTTILQNLNIQFMKLNDLINFRALVKDFYKNMMYKSIDFSDIIASMRAARYIDDLLDDLITYKTNE